MTNVALVTGAARGIGLATARRFLDQGWCVAMLDIDGPELDRSLREVATPERVVGLACDVSDADALQSAFSEVAERFGHINALVNNAGVAVFKPLLETTQTEWKRVLDVNLTGPFLCTTAAVPLMPRGGSIVNIASISGMRASTLRVAYGTSKAGLMHLTRQMAVELAEIGLRVNCIAPGPVDTAMAKAVHSNAIRADYHDAIPLGRYGLEEEIAHAILFLCSEHASYITGQVLGVDGGFEAAGIGLKSLRSDDA